MLTTAGDLIPIAQEHDITDFDELQKYTAEPPDCHGRKVEAK